MTNPLPTHSTSLGPSSTTSQGTFSSIDTSSNQTPIVRFGKRVLPTNSVDSSREFATSRAPTHVSSFINTKYYATNAPRTDVFAATTAHRRTNHIKLASPSVVTKSPTTATKALPLPTSSPPNFSSTQPFLHHRLASMVWTYPTSIS